MKDRGFRAGAARVEITPPVGIELAGYTPRVHGDNVSIRVHDPLWARVLALSDGSRTVLLIVLDLLGIELETTRQLRAEICRRLPLGPESILVACTHSHSAPSILAHHETHVAVDPVWRAWMLQSTVDAACTACHRLQPAQLDVGRAAVHAVGANRKVLLDDGTLFYFSGLYGRQLPAGRTAVEVGPVDPEITVLRARDPAGRILALVATYACHPWLYNGNQVSSEIAGACVAYLEARLGAANPGVVALYAPGTGSDITTVQNQTPIPQGIAQKEAWYTAERARMGAILGEAAVRALGSSGAPVVPGPVMARTDPIAAPAYYEPLATVLARHGSLPPPEDTLHTEVQVLAAGGLSIVGLPSEVYVEYGLEIKRRSRAAQTMVLSYCNDYFADLITDQALAEGKCPELDWTRVHPDVRHHIMAALEGSILDPTPADERPARHDREQP